MSRKVRNLPIEGCYTSTILCHKDARGTFSEVAKGDQAWSQISISTSKGKVFRGIHVSPYGKLISCLKGSMTDYVIDLRKSSRTFLMWTCVNLSEDDGTQVYIAKGCGHAFISGNVGCTVLYCQEGIFDSSKDLNVVWNDSTLNIQWDMDKEKKYTMSEKDENALELKTIAGYENVLESKPVCLVIGGNGQVGRALMRQMGKTYIPIGTYASCVETAHECLVHFDLQGVLQNKDSICDLLEKTHPKVVFLCSALTNVNECDENREKCEEMNARAPALIARECSRRNIKLVYFSTDYVFNGKNGPYLEDETVDLEPLNAYGTAKLNAEKEILKEHAHFSYIVRTTGVYGPDTKKHNFVHQVLRHITHHQPFMVSNDQISNPIFSEDLACAALQLVHEKDVPPGIYNIAGPSLLTRYEFAMKIVEAMGLGDACKRFIVPCCTEELYHSNQKYVDRPKKSGLIVQKVWEQTNNHTIKPRSIEEVLLKVWNPFNDSTVQKVWYAPHKFQSYGDEETAAVQKCLKDGWISPGPLTSEFETKVANYFGKKHGVMVNSGSSANMLALAVLNLKGKEAITPACTFATCVAPMEQLGIQPVFVDVELRSYVPSIEAILLAITPNTGCIFIPNLIGSKINWKELRQKLPRKDIWLIEDSCDTMTFTQESDISITSFYASHIITAGGCGGMVMFNDCELSNKAVMYRDWGRMGTNTEDFGERFHNSSVDGIPYDFKFLYGVLGYNFKCCEMNAAFGLAQLQKLDLFQSMRKRNVDRYMQRLKDTKNYILPLHHEQYDWLAFPLMSQQRTKLLQYLEENNVQVRVCFAGNITRHPAFRHYLQEFPNSDAIMQQGFLLGAHHGLTIADVDRCCDLLISFDSF